MLIRDGETLKSVQEKGLRKLLPAKPMITVGYGTCGIGNGADLVYNAFSRIIKEKKLDILLTKTGCFGFCAEEPLVNIYMPKKPLVILSKVTEKDVPKIIEHLKKGTVPVKMALCRIDEWDHLTYKHSYGFGGGFEKIPLWNEIPFFKWQKKIVLRDAGLIDPEDIEQYIAVGGYRALFKALTEMKPDRVIEEVQQAKLRGRGGAGFSTGRKWEMMRQTESDQKYVICNADEGDPGAYMNRNEIESDPHMLLEGMIIGAYAMGCSQGIIYIRAEYPLAVERMKRAIEQAKAYGILGTNIMGSSFSFDLSLVEGAGAFVCGEETALMASIEGKAGRSRPRPPFPAQKGFRDKPTNINNVETWSNVPVVISKGSEWFSQTGTKSSPGTKVFSLVGKIKNTGLVELPLGEPLETIVYQIGEGTGTLKRVKAVQTGGPSGGCIPVELFNTPVDYESLNAIGAIMGSGGMVVMDQDNCMVDVARYFIEFTNSESCGKCTPCREGLSQEFHILQNITEGRGTEKEMATLSDLGNVIRDTALCGLGQTAPNPVLTTLKYFKHEYEEHILEKRCYSGTCQSLFMALCENSCPMHMNIPGYLELLKEDRLEEAFELTLRDNPIPASIGRICHFHCMMRCRREQVDEAVSQGEIHRYIADTMYQIGREKKVYERLIKEKLPPTGKKIAVIGAGPAGLTAAFYLVRMGHEVTVYDSHAKAGGIIRYGIPAYRLPKEIVDKETDLIRKLGVKFVMNTVIGKTKKMEALDKEFDAIVLAMGAQKDIELDIPGKDLKGVLPGYEFLEEFAAGEKTKTGKNVVIIGGGNVAIDAARTIWRMGSKVTVVYRRDKKDMPANRTEIQEAEAEGVKFVYMSGPEKIIGDGKGNVKGLEVMKMTAGGYDTSGRKKPVPTGETAELPCDTVVVAIGEKVDTNLLSVNGIQFNKNGTVKTGKMTMMTNKQKIFAIGDAVTGPATAAEAMGIAKRAAEQIDIFLTGENRFKKLFREFTYGNKVPLKPEGGKMNVAKKFSVKERLGNFQEVSHGFTAEQAKLEATRCLRCDVREPAEAKKAK